MNIAIALLVGALGGFVGCCLFFVGLLGWSGVREAIARWRQRRAERRAERDRKHDSSDTMTDPWWV